LSKYDVDINHILVKPVYFGLLMNIFVPVLILGIAYYLENSGGAQGTIQKSELNIFFWALAAVSLGDGVIAIYFKHKNFMAPMIRSKETFEEDLAWGVFTRSIICYSMTTAIAVYGLVFYFFGGSFMHLFFFVFLSFIAFQLIRPRYGFIEKVLAAQEKHVEEGRFLTPKN
jgi:hypothetical protein